MEKSNGDSPLGTQVSGSYNTDLSSPFRDSSPENLPCIDRHQMDTSVELNGLKSCTGNQSQQFCLRWNNHQVCLNCRKGHKQNK